MFRNYLKIAWRNQVKNKTYSLINIGGMAVGMAVALLIGLWIWDELSFNKHHEYYDRIAIVVQNNTIDGEIETNDWQVAPLGKELRDHYGSNFKHVVTSSVPNSHILSVDDRAVTQYGSFMEAGAPEMFSLKMKKGTHSGLQDLNAVLLSQSAAKALFGNVDPMGKTIKIDNNLDVQVKGVYEDFPDNSEFRGLQFIAPWDLLIRSKNLVGNENWVNNWCYIYVQLAEHVDIHKASAAIKDAKLKKVSEGNRRFNPQLFLFPMEKWRLYAGFEEGVNVGGYIRFVWLFGAIGAFVLLLACINFMNLSTARSQKRAKEIGIRKVIGSGRNQLIGQFFGESLLVAFMAFLLSLILVQLSLPWFNEVADKKMAILWTEPLFWLWCLGFTILTGIIAGGYPALYLSSFRPAHVLKGAFRPGRFSALPRKALVILQFTVSVTFIIATIIVYQQIQYAKNRPIGYKRDGLLSIPIKTDEVRNNFSAFRNDLMASGAVLEVALSQNAVTEIESTNYGFQWKGKAPGLVDQFSTMTVDQEWGKTVGWKIKEGRDFSKEFATDSSAIILNEKAVKYMGFENPVGETVRAFGRNYTVIGVAEDLVMQSVYHPVNQTIYFLNTFYQNKIINIRIDQAVSAGKAVAEIGALFKKHNPATPFEYHFVEDELAAKWAFEERIGKLAGFFAVLAILISCLGLFGLAAFMAEQRTKEIGIRKVLGASVQNITLLISRDFVKLVLLAIVIAMPIAWYFMEGWLQDFAYRINISWWIFAAAGLLALAIALATVSYQAIKAARINPVKNLRTE
ncbi:hypothetical protein D770_23070 [Flammeovirgaceae bacterium 311]|nr:hypothetical protein D770_23070 [Flammeovirgaceae bacterium 311]